MTGNGQSFSHAVQVASDVLEEAGCGPLALADDGNGYGYGDPPWLVSDV